MTLYAKRTSDSTYYRLTVTPQEAIDLPGYLSEVSAELLDEAGWTPVTAQVAR